MRELNFCLLLIVLSASQVMGFEAATEVPFSFERGHVIVQAKIKKDVSVEVAIATGAKHSSVDISLTEKYGLSRGYAGEPPVTGHNDRIYFFSVVPDFRIGNAKTSSLTMRLVSTANISNDVGREIFGIVGADFFKGRIAQFDFNRKVITFLSESDKTRRDADASAGSADFCTLRIAENGDPYDNVTLPAATGVTFDSQKITTLFDTGTALVIGLSSSAAKKAGVKSLPDKDSATAKIGVLRLGNCELKDVPAIVAAKGSNFEKSFGENRAVVGVGVLQNFLVTFDFRSNLIVLDRR